MTLPVPPSPATVLRNGIVTLREVLMPLTKDDEWARFNGGLLLGALQYALEALGEDRARRNREQLGAVLKDLKLLLEKSGIAELVKQLDQPSPFEAASQLLVWGQNNPGELADELQMRLRAELYAQLDRELTAAEPIMGAFERGMRGEV